MSPSPKKNLYSALQRKTIDQMLRLATSQNKRSLLLAAQLAEKLTPAHRKREVNWVIDQIREEKPVLQIARHVARDLSPNVRKAVIQSLDPQRPAADLQHARRFHRAHRCAHTPGLAHQPHHALQPGL